MKESLKIAKQAERSLQRSVDHIVKEHEQTGEPLVATNSVKPLRRTSNLHSRKTNRADRRRKLLTRHQDKLNRPKHHTRKKSVKA